MLGRPACRPAAAAARAWQCRPGSGGGDASGGPRMAIGVKPLSQAAADLPAETTATASPPSVPGRRRQASQTAPPALPATPEQLRQLHDFVAGSRRLAVLTGAGMSTESGIPDYRSPQGAYSSGFKPMTHQEFVRSLASRTRYWARSYIGWRRYVSAAPGAAHTALARLEQRGRVAGGMITQNVDRLHHAAGSRPLELHGTTHEVVCLDCANLSDRYTFQDRMKDLNRESVSQWAAAVEVLEQGTPGSEASFGMRTRPDGDIEIGEEFWRQADLRIPSCLACSGSRLKPNVVFFGDNVPKPRVEDALGLVTSADALLVVGSSLMVLSAFRLARAAADAGKPIALLTIGPTRADELASLKIGARCGEVLSRLVATGSMDVPVL
eukprot:SM000252S09078  [mRNA]  locus=s252:89305:92269:- [translate_table: standard]